MKNPIQLTINIALLLAVAVLYFLHFNNRAVAPAIATDKSVAVMASPELSTADTTAAAEATEAPALAAATTTAAPQRQHRGQDCLRGVDQNAGRLPGHERRPQSL